MPQDSPIDQTLMTRSGLRLFVRPALAGLVIRVAVSLIIFASAGAAGLRDYDTDGYESLGRSLSQGIGYQLVWHDVGSRPGFHRTPGLPALIGAVYAVGGGPLVVVLLQGLFDVFAIFGVGVIARWFWCADRPGRIAAWLYALLPGGVVMSSQLMSESLSTSAYIIALALVVVAVATGRTRWLPLAALSFALSAYVRPSAIYFGVLAFVLVAGVFLVARERRRALMAALSVGLLLACLVPWGLRNRALTGTFFFSPLAALKMGNDATNLRARISGTTQDAAYEAFARELGAPRPSIEPSDQPFKQVLKRNPTLAFAAAPLWRHYAITHLGTAAVLYLRTVPKHLLMPHMARFFGALAGRPTRPAHEHSRAFNVARAVLLRAEVVVLGLLYLAIFAGLVVRIRDRRRLWFTGYLVVTIGVLFAAMGLDVQARYRLQAEPLMWVVSAGAFALAYDCAKKRLQRSASSEAAHNELARSGS